MRSTTYFKLRCQNDQFDKALGKVERYMLRACGCGKVADMTVDVLLSPLVCADGRIEQEAFVKIMAANFKAISKAAPQVCCYQIAI